ncbi:MAG: hypothetical protein KBB01_05445 [Candidatus Omnitrophica bacterium]|jgi:hypothetical protein|nr:hypothetical protein [Candidatus Omnitrophota bacterium]
MKKKGVILIILGIVGITFICLVDVFMGKPVNDVTGPKSIIGLVICGIFVISGIYILQKSSSKNNII